MQFKPGDFFLGIVTFLGVLLPGAVLVFLRGRCVRQVFPLQDFEPQWVMIAITAYIVGQILLAITEPLNKLAGLVAAKTPYVVHRVLRIFMKHKLPPPAKRVVSAQFHEAISYVRLRSAAAVGEIDRHMADYKLLRNLIAVFLIDGVWSTFDNPRNPSRALWDGTLAVLSFIGFVRMHYWAQLLAIQYKDLVQDKEKSRRLIHQQASTET